jgi:hypothetical protein
MCGWKVRFVKEAALVAAAFLLSSPQVQAGKQSTPQNWSAPVYHSAPAPVIRVAAQPVTVSVAVTPARVAPEVFYVNLRGPDGQVRRFPVEGGRAAIQTPEVIVLRPGISVTIRWVVAR